MRTRQSKIARWVVILTIALAGVLCTPPLAQAADTPTPDQDQFYTAPADLSGYAPGDLIRRQPTTVKVAVLPVPVKAEQIVYRSTSHTGAATAVSGIVLTPLTPWPSGSRPLIGYAVSTHGLNDRCAPSYKLRIGTEQEASVIGGALLKNWSVVITDYAGLGTPGIPHYTVGREAAFNQLDAVRAAERISASGVSATSPVVLWGYSQGGQATALAAELASQYAPELSIKGAAAGGVPAQFQAVIERVDRSMWVSLAIAALAGYRAAYPELGIDALLNDKGKTALTQSEAGCLIGPSAGTAFHSIDEYTIEPGVYRRAEVQAKFPENEPGALAPRIPIYLYHATADEIIPVAQLDALRSKYCQAGVAVRTARVSGANHLSGLYAGAQGTVGWIADRFAGRAAPTSC